VNTNKVLISVPITGEKEAFRKALKAVAATKGKNIGEFVADLLLRECGDALGKYISDFSVSTGYISEHMDSNVSNFNEDKIGLVIGESLLEEDRHA
jgi:hypothetical protein